ncbi:hypothetical protein AX17_004816 [Amanita inopinata Kibby_2008]|nr:hypothetical protein AX17_004816 [Amanita inopinata Kibby_2008]
MCLCAESSRQSQRIDILNVEITHEFKLGYREHPFDDDLPGFERDEDRAWNTLGQITRHATAHVAAQFRTHIFMVLIFSQYARLLRWDRAGVIVTKKFSFGSPSIAEFYWRYCHATSEKRGHDISVSEGLGDFEMDPAYIRRTLGLPFNCRLCRLSLGPGYDVYVFGTPSTYMGAYSPTGRSTRVFKAICLQNNQIVCIKDTWRIASNGYKAEHLIHEKLKAADVQYIPRLKEAADILDHGTGAHLVANGDWVTSKPWALRTFHHYRMVFLDIGRKLWCFKTKKDYVTAMRDAHQQAYYKAHILHYDISARNILITENGGGMLIDWDLCKDMNEPTTGSGRRSTWRFISARLLADPEDNDDPTPIPDHLDDLESFYHVLIWIALKFAANQLKPAQLRHTLDFIYDQDKRGIFRGGYGKHAEFGISSYVRDAHLKNPPLVWLTHQLRRLLSVRYFECTRPRDFELMQKLDSRDGMMKVFDEALLRSDWEIHGERIENEIRESHVSWGTKRQTITDSEDEVSVRQLKKSRID